MIPNFITHVHPTTGEVVLVQISQGINPPEGFDETSGLHIFHIYSELYPQEISETLYYDFSSSIWKTREKKPNPYCTWSPEHNWQCDFAQFLTYIRRLRNIELTKTDWTQISDASLTEEQKTEAQIYRQALRDMTLPIQQNPENYLTEESLPWPTPPTFLNIEI